MEEYYYATLNRQQSVQSDNTNSSGSGNSDKIIRTHKSGLINPPESKVLEYQRSWSGGSDISSVYGPIPYS